MTDTEEVPVAASATAVNGDQPAEPAAKVAEPADTSLAESKAAAQPERENTDAVDDAQPASNKAKATPARARAGEAQQSAERPSGRRERKQTSFFQPEKKAETEKLEIKEGQGIKLGEIPNVTYRLGKVTGRDELLEDLHQILYGRKGKLSTRKRDISAFSGFTFADDQQEAEAEKAKSLMSRFKNDHMLRLLDLLDIPRTDLKDKETRIEKVLEFLKAPSQLSDKDLAAKMVAENAASKQQMQSRGSKTEEGEKKAAAARKRQRKDKDQEGKATDAKPKRAKKTKEAAGEEEEEEVEEQEDAAAADEEGDDEDEKPLGAMVPKKGKVPTEEELQKEIVKVLNGVNVLEFNIKMLMKHLNDKYKMDLTDLKPFIKTVAIHYCNEHAPKDNAEV